MNNPPTTRIIIPEKIEHEELPKAPDVSKETRDIISQGGQILLPFYVADAQVTFSRWRLAELIEEAINNAKREGMGY